MHSADKMLFQHGLEESIDDACRRFYEDDHHFGPIVKHFAEGVVLVDRKNGTPKHRHYHLDDSGLLWFWPSNIRKSRLCIPDNGRLKERVIREKHDVFTSAHPGVGKTEFSVQQDYYWKGLSRDVDRYVASCETCQRVKARQTKPPGTLNPLPIPETRWADIYMDFIVKLQMSMWYDAILVIVD